jgi:hypothetical protein
MNGENRTLQQGINKDNKMQRLSEVRVDNSATICEDS